MKLRIVNLIIWAVLATIVISNSEVYFDDGSCLSRLPDPELKFEKISPARIGLAAPFKIDLSKTIYDLTNLDTLSVSIRSINPLAKLDGFMIQAVLNDDKLNKVVGIWKQSGENVRIIDCNAARDTLIKSGAENNDQYEWELIDLGQIEDYSQVKFIATVVTTDKTYWVDIESEPIKLIKKSDDDEKSSKLIESRLDLASLPPKPAGKSIAKRDSAKQFELSTSQCGSRKSCYVSLKTCDIDPKTCNFVLSWDYDGELINFELTALSSYWVGVVFSEDQQLGDDNLVVCLKEANSDKVSVVHYYKNSTSSDLIRLSSQDDNLRKQFGHYSPDGYINCRFSRPKYSDNPLVSDLSKPHYIYVERGSPNELISTKLNERFQPSDSRIEFASGIYVPPSPRSWVIRVHAILGIIAWIFCGSIGILLARYYKPLWPNYVLFSFRVWFAAHRVLMLSVTILSIFCLLFALIELDWKWSKDGNDLLHAILGIVVIVCALINPLLGFCRPRPDSKLRCLFFWCHWLIGTVAYCLAVPTIFIGMDLSKSDIPNWCAWLLFAWVIFHIIVEIILEVHYCCTFYRLQGNYNEYNYDYDKNRKLQKKLKNPPGYRWKPSLLFIYIIVTTIVVIALMIEICLFDF